MAIEVPIEKIRKLLALAGSSNEHEAKRAMERAQALCARFNMTVERAQQMDADPLQRGYVRITIEDGKVAPLHMKFIGGIVTKYFFVKAIAHVPDDRIHPRPPHVVHVCGLPHYAEVAEHVYLYLRATYKRLWLEYRKLNGIPPSQTAKQTSYYQGITLGIMDHLAAARRREEQQASRASGMAIAVVDDPGLRDGAQALCREYAPGAAYEDAKPIKQRDMDKKILLDGYVKGMQTGITPAVGGTDSTGHGSGEVDENAPLPSDRPADGWRDVARDIAGPAPYEPPPPVARDLACINITCWSCKRSAPYFRDEAESATGAWCVFCREPVTGDAAAARYNAIERALVEDQVITCWACNDTRSYRVGSAERAGGMVCAHCYEPIMGPRMAPRQAVVAAAAEAARKAAIPPVYDMPPSDTPRTYVSPEPPPAPPEPPAPPAPAPDYDLPINVLRVHVPPEGAIAPAMGGTLEGLSDEPVAMATDASTLQVVDTMRASEDPDTAITVGIVCPDCDELGTYPEHHARSEFGVACHTCGTRIGIAPDAQRLDVLPGGVQQGRVDDDMGGGDDAGI